MAVRDPGGARLRPALGGRAVARVRRLLTGRAFGLTAFYAAAAVVATAPAVASFRSAFIAGGAQGYGEAAAGDHLQSVYRFWLVGHQLGRGDVPWRDPYSFQPLVEPQLNLNGWPFGWPFWPLDALFGPVVAWNVLLLACIVAAGLATYGWLRSLRLPWAAALLGGLAFAIAPYRLAQSSGHLIGWLAVLLPVVLWTFERSRGASGWRAHAWGAASALALLTIPASGQVHLALGAIPFCVAYAAIRFRRPAFWWVVTGAAAGIGVGLAIRQTIIAGSTADRGRSLDQVEQFQADWLDLVSRFRLEGLEQFVYVGWLVPVVAAVGLVVLARRKPWLAALLGIAVVVPLILAVGTHFPLYEYLWRYVPPLRFPRVPARLIPVADLALAALVAVAAAWGLAKIRPGRRTLALVVATLLVAGDLLVLPFRPTAADPENAAYAALAPARGRVLELPLFEPGIHYGSIYNYYALQTPRERPSGYSTLAPPPPYAFFWSLNRMNCGIVRPADLARLLELHIGHIVFHTGAYLQSGRANAWFAWQALQDAGYRAQAGGGRVWLYPVGARTPGAARQPAPVREPDRAAPVLCEGWRGWRMKERDAPLWLYGEQNVEIELTSPAPTFGYVYVDGGTPTRFEVEETVTLAVELDGARWHSIVIEIPALFPTKPPQGFEIVRLTYR